MGDFADDANDRAMNQVDQLYEHCEDGFPCDQEAYDNGIIDELGCDLYTEKDFAIPRGSRFVRVKLVKKKWFPCKHCGFKKLVWKDTEKGWRLAHPDGEEHSCDEYLEATAWRVDDE